MFLLIGVAVFALLTVYLFLTIQRERNLRARLPPGPKPWPIVGNIEYLLSGPGRHELFRQTGKDFNGMFGFNVGKTYSVMVTSYRLFREANIEKTWPFAGRPMDIQFPELIPGIVTCPLTEDFKEVRRFVMTSLKSFGFGKADTQHIILEETQHLVDAFAKHHSRPFNPRPALVHTAANIISGVVLGRRFDQDDTDFQYISARISDALHLLAEGAKVNAFPILKLRPQRAWRAYRDNFRTTKRFISGIIDEDEATRSPGNPRQFVDAWLDHLEKMESGRKGAFSKDKLLAVVIDLIGGGFDTTVTALLWTLLLLLHNPDSQDKIHQELDAAVGKGVEVHLEHRDLLVYTDAVVWEALRLFPVFPTGVPHATIEDTRLGGHDIPAGTRVIFHHYSIQRDPDLWNEPEAFKPERFLEKGKLKIPDYHVVFSAGRRSCIGEQLASKELFLILVNILHRFTISVPPGTAPVGFALHPGVTLQPEQFEIVAFPRH